MKELSEEEEGQSRAFCGYAGLLTLTRSCKKPTSPGHCISSAFTSSYLWTTLLRHELHDEHDHALRMHGSVLSAIASRAGHVAVGAEVKPEVDVWDATLHFSGRPSEGCT